jgi:hypothetical protein
VSDPPGQDHSLACLAASDKEHRDQEPVIIRHPQNARVEQLVLQAAPAHRVVRDIGTAAVGASANVSGLEPDRLTVDVTDPSRVLVGTHGASVPVRGNGGVSEGAVTQPSGGKRAHRSEGLAVQANHRAQILVQRRLEIEIQHMANDRPEQRRVAAQCSRKCGVE